MITIEHERTFIDLSFPFRPPQSKPNMTEKIRISAEQCSAVVRRLVETEKIEISVQCRADK